MPDEPDIKQENLADTDDSPLGTTDEHAGEQDTEAGETHADPEGDEEEQKTEEERFPSTESATSASAGEGEGSESVSPPELRAPGQPRGRLTSRARGNCSTRTTLLLMFRGASGRLGRVKGTASGGKPPAWIPAHPPQVRPPRARPAAAGAHAGSEPDPARSDAAHDLI